MTDQPTIQPWDQQPDEPQIWFVRFEIYRDMGAHARTLVGAHRKVLAANDKPTTTAMSSAWNKAAKDWNWEERALAWDRHLAREIILEAKSEARQQAHDLMRATIDNLQKQVVRLLQDYTPSAQNPNAPKMKAYDLLITTQAAATIFKEARMMFGDPTEHLDVTSGGESIKVDLAAAIQEVQKVREWESQLRAKAMVASSNPTEIIDPQS